MAIFIAQIKWDRANPSNFNHLLISYFLLFFLLVQFNLKAQNKENHLDKALVNGIALGIPGISVAIGRGDSIVWRGTAGYSDVLTKTPIKTNSQFGIGSITKTFVAILALQLAEEGKLDLNNTPSDYLDSKAIKGIPNIEKATLRQVLNHQSGIPTGSFKKIGFVKEEAH